MRKDEEEQLAATGSLLNLSTESGMHKYFYKKYYVCNSKPILCYFLCTAKIVPLTNTKSVLVKLVHLAHNPKSIFDVRRMACNTLSNISL